MDLTEVSVNAIHYALEANPNSEKHVLNVRPVNVNVHADRPFHVQKRLMQSWNDELKEFVKKYIPDTNSISSFHVTMGNVVGRIHHYALELKPDAIYMGLRDKFTIVDKMIGTHSLGVVKTSKVPTYLIPGHCKFSEYQKILVGSDGHLLDSRLVDSLTAWNKTHKAFMKFLHIENTGSTFKADKDQIVEHLLDQNALDFGFEISSIPHENVAQSLLNHAYKWKSDIVIIAPDNQSFIDKMLFKSVSKELIEQTKTPLLFIH